MIDAKLSEPRRTRFRSVKRIASIGGVETSHFGVGITRPEAREPTRIAAHIKRY
jgi:hypothetical protein